MKITLLILSVLLSVVSTMRLSKVDPNSYSEPGIFNHKIFFHRNVNVS